MNKQNAFYLLIISFIFLISGCVVRTYPVTRDRVDQDLAGGNRGYIQGSAPASESKERKTNRTTQVVEVELYPPVKFEKKAKKEPREKTLFKKTPVEPSEETAGNQGYITSSYSPETLESGQVFEKYTVQKSDTLQKISKKFYGTSRKWTKIYDANKDILKGPDKIYPGQVLNIPVETLKEPQENLK